MKNEVMSIDEPLSGRTALMEACRNGDFDAARDELKKGANPNAKNRNGTTPLMYAKSAAVRNGDLTLMKLLIESGADINALDNHGKTALQYLEEHSQIVISFMKSNGAK